MATARTVETRRLASPTIRALINQRSAELLGLLLGLLGLALLVALVCYDARDPSLNTATSRHTTNLAGPVGAVLADLLLQGFGVAGALPGVAMLAWAWRIGSRRGVGSMAARLASLIAALPVLAAVFAAIPVPPSFAWPAVAGLGGAIGRVLSAAGLAAGHAAFGPFGAAMIWVVGLALALTLTLLALGLTASEWGAAWRFSKGAARFSVSGGRGAADLMGHLRMPRLPRLWRRADRAPEAGSVVRREPVTVSRQPPPRDEPPPVVARTGRPTPVRKPQQESLPLLEAGWRFPPLSLLKPAPARASSGPTEEALQANARLLETVLSDYGVQGSIVEIRPGPVVTLYELEPAPGIRSARVIGLADDIARSLSVTAVRIATVPGRNVIGIEVPNSRRETVFLSELLASDDWAKHPARLALALGKDISGRAIFADLARMPHLMIAGTTGSGKSVGVNAMILSLLYRLSPDQCRLILVDPKMLELSGYDGIPHLLTPVVTDPKKAVIALKWAVREMEDRYKKMSKVGVRNIDGFNARVAEAVAKGEPLTRTVQTGFDRETGEAIYEHEEIPLDELPYIVVVVDEMADLMMVAGKDIEGAIQRLAQMARAAGIHLIMATQRPSVDVITGTIKANFPTRISFQVTSKIDSRTILGEQGAEQLLGQGDMLYMAGGGRISRVHGPFVSENEVEKVVTHLKRQGAPEYLHAITEEEDAGGDDDDEGPLPSPGSMDAEESADYYDRAVNIVLRDRKVSTSYIQRRLSVGYNKAASLVERMEKEGVVSPPNHSGKREILIGNGVDRGAFEDLGED